MAKKAYQKEIQELPNTIKWSFEEPVSESFKKIVSIVSAYPLLVVGSGGSFSGAQFIAQIHERVTGFMSRAITPLELISSDIIPFRHAVLLLTSTGNNKDILNTLSVTVSKGFSKIAIICASINSKIVKNAKNYPYVQYAEFKNPAGKDGFLAVNSLLSTCILTARAYNAITKISIKKHLSSLIENQPSFDSPNWKKVLSRRTILAISGEWGLPAMVDLESKFTEAALGNVSIADFRNFGHGRHHWFDKNGDDSALLAIETPNMRELSQKTLKNLPERYPTAILRTELNGPLGGIDLLRQIFLFVGEAGKNIKIDPGMPNVPEFGRKIYSIGLTPVLKKLKTNKDIWLYRKSCVSGLPINTLSGHLDRFLQEFEEKKFSGIVMDYDGTLCDPPERFSQPKKEIKLFLNNLLFKDIIVAIATGRGHSVQDSLRASIEKKYWDKMIIGNYNGAHVLKLSENIPNFDNDICDSISIAAARLREDSILKEFIKIKVRNKQISIILGQNFNRKTITERIFEALYDVKEIKILFSDHSVDIIDSSVSKVNVVNEVRKRKSSKNDNILIIGDQGQIGGNDFEMLKEPYSISVNKISSDISTCWNLSPSGKKGAEAMISIFNCMKLSNNFFEIDTDALEREVSGWTINLQ